MPSFFLPIAQDNDLFISPLTTEVICRQSVPLLCPVTVMIIVWQGYNCYQAVIIKMLFIGLHHKRTNNQILTPNEMNLFYIGKRLPRISGV